MSMPKSAERLGRMPAMISSAVPTENTASDRARRAIGILCSAASAGRHRGYGAPVGCPGGEGYGDRRGRADDADPRQHGIAEAAVDQDAAEPGAACDRNVEGRGNEARSEQGRVVRAGENAGLYRRAESEGQRAIEEHQRS